MHIYIYILLSLFKKSSLGSQNIILYSLSNHYPFPVAKPVSNRKKYGQPFADKVN